MNKKMTARVIGAALAVSLVASACSDTPESTDTSAPTSAAKETTTTKSTEAMKEKESETTKAGDSEEAGNIVEVAQANPDFSILVEAIIAADLTDALSADGELTVFAPTDKAFEAFLEEAGLTKEELLASEDLAAILQYHVLGTKVDADAALEAATANASVETLQGGELALSLDGEKIKVANATVVEPDVEASNGVIHAIDQVIPLPA